MTDFKKIEDYYRAFDEWNRLEDPSGRLEYLLTMDIILNHFSQGDHVLDLGGGPGRYSIELAKLGYKTYLADLSEDLLKEAELNIQKMNVDNVQSVKKVNATDLSVYQSATFNAVLLLGPLYHLTTSKERQSCIKEVYRVLKPNGIIIASFIPYLSGAVGIVDRYFRDENQVNQKNLMDVFYSGVFHNQSDNGFQEGYYPKLEEIETLFAINGFMKKTTRSIRSFAYSREDKILKLKEHRQNMYDTMIKLIHETATEKSIVETCGHALYIGIKKDNG